MKHIAFSCFAFFFLFLFSCKKSDDELILPAYLEGNWACKYSMHTYTNDVFVDSTNYEFELKLNLDGTGEYRLPQGAVKVYWTTSFDQSLVFLTIEDTYTPPEKRLLSYRLEVLVNKPDFQLWLATTKRGGGAGFVEFQYWRMYKI